MKAFLILLVCCLALTNQVSARSTGGDDSVDDQGSGGSRSPVRGGLIATSSDGEGVIVHTPNGGGAIISSNNGNGVAAGTSSGGGFIATFDDGKGVVAAASSSRN